MHELYSLNRRDKRRREYWRHLVKTFESSGLKQNIFCEQQGIKQEDLQRWIFKFQSYEPQDKSNRPLLNFVPVEIVQETSPSKIKSNTHMIELHHRSGFYPKFGSRKSSNIKTSLMLNQILFESGRFIRVSAVLSVTIYS